MPRMENGSRLAFDLAVAAVHLFSVAFRAFVQTKRSHTGKGNANSGKISQ